MFADRPEVLTKLHSSRKEREGKWFEVQGPYTDKGHAQVLVNAIDFGMNVQEAGEAARVNHGNNGLQVESAMPEWVIAALTERGHNVVHSVGAYGGYQGIMFDVRGLAYYSHWLTPPGVPNRFDIC